MNFLVQHIHDLIKTYDGSAPLAIVLKSHLKNHPKLGSRDRRAISQGLYLYYRYARRLSTGLSPFEVILNGLHHSGIKDTYLETMLLRQEEGLLSKIVPLDDPDLTLVPKLSAGIEVEKWLESFLVQPDVFIRTRDKNVAAKLEESGTPYTIPGDIQPKSGNQLCLAVPNGTKLEKILADESYVVQDWASQQSVHLIVESMADKNIRSVWDTCAGAGGKSLMLKDYLPGANILATDIRKSILVNLAERFEKYHLTAPETRVLDVSAPADLRKKGFNRKFDLVLCDVPCSGSGTWARTPEQYYFFDRDSLKQMSETQYRIISNAARFLNEGGVLAYITCSVFEEENENVVDRLLSDQNLTLLHKALINGTDLKADSMFVTIFAK